MKRTFWTAVLFGVVTTAQAGVVSLTQNFDNLAASGWLAINVSSPLGTTSWFQGNPAVFAAQSGAADSYAAANFLSTDPGGGTISTWLLSPEIDFSSQTLSFFARAADALDDALNVMISLDGASVSLADFSLLLAINAGNATGGMPTDWTMFSALLAGSGSGRIAFQYTAGPNNFADYIGVDTVDISGKRTVPEPATPALLVIGLVALARATHQRRRVRAAISGPAGEA